MAKPVSQQLSQKSDRNLAEWLPFAVHGDSTLPAAIVDSYNLELRERGKFIGDRANKDALAEVISQRRKLAQKNGRDPLGDTPTDELTKKKLEKILAKGDAAAAGVVQAALDDFAERIVNVVRRFLKVPEWKKVERIAIGGGFRGGRIGELVIGRAQTLLDAEKGSVELQPIRADPDDAGLIGAAYLAPSWIFAGYDGILAVDIGGTNIRCGVLRFKSSRPDEMLRPKVIESLIWEHAEEEINRNEAVAQLVSMLQKLIRKAAKDRFRLAPFIGIGCPGRVRVDGAIDRGTQNLPGNWEAERFHLPLHLRQNISIIPGQETVVVIHNDAVVQGLSELPFMRDVKHWAILTIGTGLGNAKFTTRLPLAKRTDKKKPAKAKQ